MSQQCRKYEQLHHRCENNPSKRQLETRQPQPHKYLEQLKKIGQMSTFLSK
jgi:hypothetical protein